MKILTSSAIVVIALAAGEANALSLKQCKILGIATSSDVVAGMPSKAASAAGPESSGKVVTASSNELTLLLRGNNVTYASAAQPQGNGNVTSASAAQPQGNGNVTSASAAQPQGNGNVTSASAAQPQGNGNVTSASAAQPQGNGNVTSASAARPQGNGNVTSASAVKTNGGRGIVYLQIEGSQPCEIRIPVRPAKR